MRQKLSVIIPTFNTEKILRDCLETVAWADEIICIDMGSTDQTLEICRDYNARIIRNIPDDRNFDINRKIGIEKAFYKKTLRKEGLDPDYFGSVLFKNYDDEILLMKESLISMKTLKQELVNKGIILENEKIPASVEKIYKRSEPKFKTQVHFYGYDGRGNDPTRFDCIYTYNLGLTVFSLIVNGATGQMASIKNLEMDFSKWEPIGIPIAPLMHLEERKGKLALVLEKSVVEVNSISFRVVKELREKWLAASHGEDSYRRPGPVRFDGESEEDRPITLSLNAIR